MRNIEIMGTGSYLPGEPINNEQIAEVFGREAIWLSEMLGARTRHFAIDLNSLELRPNESNTNMATQAAKLAIEDAGIDTQSIDLLIMATSTPDYPFPATALFVQEKLGISDCCVMELRAGCGGMAQAFMVATQLIATGESNKALLIGSDLISPYISLFKGKNYNPEISKDYFVSLSMFGDGAGAVILSASEDQGVLDCMSKSASTGNPPGMILRTGGALAPVGKLSESKDSEIFHHDFKAILEHGPNLIKKANHWLRHEKGYDLSQVDYFVPPQVNTRLIGLTAAQMEVKEDRVFSNFERVGNTVSASIYIALDQMNREGVLRPNDLLVLLPCEGTKWVYGAIVVRWTKA